ncbi:ABC-type multidrug transport system ATPase subunit [Microcella alkaliphila]|uniref:ABC-type multidrug transport system ATPase subunit n=1 Tax=Microcella alkaliphila TaxID=279828 RepID=A0A4Q7TN87_9MICO|nr:ABC transporter ATP-binding protein [Microcella alkaliphila]RZT62295.1 ABC-type multidrug transport system ATPase subunit [Microcella alkaliphila]
MTIAPAISAAGVARSFGDVHAVRDASFTAHFGQVTALIGPNGSGKTTLLLMLATLLKPDAGEIRIDGHDPVTDARAVRQVTGWMPDVLGSWGSLTVRQSIETTARLYELSPADARARATELIDRIGLGPLADQPSRVLSRGQKQKLSLARALVHRPRVLLLDEPASGLDPAARVELRVLVRELAADGAAVLLSSHVLAELDEMSDAAVYLDRGATASAESVDRARASARRWRIRALDAAALTAALADAGRPAVGADHLGALVEVTGEADAAALLTHLVSAGVGIAAYGPAVGDLEQTFLDLAKGGER